MSWFVVVLCDFLSSYRRSSRRAVVGTPGQPCIPKDRDQTGALAQFSDVRSRWRKTFSVLSSAMWVGGPL